MWSLHSVRQSVADRAQDSPVRNIYHLDFPSRCIQDKNKTYPVYIHLEVRDVRIRVDNSELNTFSGTWKSSNFFLCFFHISRLTQLTNTNIKMNKTSQLSRQGNQLLKIWSEFHCCWSDSIKIVICTFIQLCVNPKGYPFVFIEIFLYKNKKLIIVLSLIMYQ